METSHARTGRPRRHSAAISCRVGWRRDDLEVQHAR
jgi:hypothetical protein